MDLRTKANELLAVLAKNVGLGFLSLNKITDEAVLEIGPVPIHFVLSEETGELVSIARITSLPEERRARSEALVSLMEANYAWSGTGGGILGLEEESGFICLSQRYNLSAMRPTVFEEQIERQRSLAAFFLEKLWPNEQQSGLKG
jgi:hypothetical protein